MNKKIKNTIYRISLSTAVVLFLLFGLQDCATTYQSQSSSYTNNNQNYAGYNLADLNNYGYWVQTNIYGEAWRPYVAQSWAPFENGHWTLADGNWTWVSYEPFGWIVYHYGNWYNDPYYGWVWIPSSGTWSPARVVWYDYDNYIAWAPMPPARVSYGLPWEANQYHYWHVVKSKDFTNDNVKNYWVANPGRGNNILRNNAGERNTAERNPPSVQKIRNATGRPIPDIKVQRQRVNLPGRNVEKMVLPTPEEKRIERNTERVRKEILVSPSEYRKREVQTRDKQQQELLRKQQQENEQLKNEQQNNEKQKAERQKEDKQRAEPQKREPRQRDQNQQPRPR